MNPTPSLRHFPAKVETRLIRSASMNEDINLNVVVPDSIRQPLLRSPL